MPHLIRLTLVITSLLTFISTGLANAPKKSLTELNHSIQGVKQSLASDTLTRNQLQNELKNSEVKASHLHMRLYQLSRQQRRHQSQLSQLHKQHGSLKQQLRQQQTALSQQIRMTYQMHSQPELWLLLAPNQNQHIDRMLTYLHYLNQQRQHTIQQIKFTLTQLNNNQHAIQTKKTALSRDQQHQQQEQQTLTSTSAKRKTLINSLNRRINSDKAKLHILTHNKHQLEQAVGQLQAAPNPRAFNFIQHRLPWPTKGQITHHFGQAIEHSELSWSGVVIQAHAGTPVQAVASGQVVFAKWLSGYGLLLIINHGKGYMSLYGRNQSLFKHVGDTVSKGETISTVGNSGGYQQPGLYFSLRHNADPINPTKWCSRG